jgi:hypothetical protein
MRNGVLFTTEFKRENSISFYLVNLKAVCCLQENKIATTKMVAIILYKLFKFYLLIKK